MIISDEKFQGEFNVHNDEDIEQFVAHMEETDVSSYDQLRLKISIAKHVECCNIYLTFSETFRLDAVPADTMIKIFDNIGNRLQYISGNNPHHFIIVHCIYDERIFTSMITEDSIP